jgi:hypothetical protein
LIKVCTILKVKAKAIGHKTKLKKAIMPQHRIMQTKIPVIPRHIIKMTTSKFVSQRQLDLIHKKGQIRTPEKIGTLNKTDLMIIDPNTSRLKITKRHKDSGNRTKAMMAEEEARDQANNVKTEIQITEILDKIANKGTLHNKINQIAGVNPRDGIQNNKGHNSHGITPIITLT